MDDNVYFDWELGDEKATADALGSAAKVIELTVTNNRVIPNAMEPRLQLQNMTKRARVTHFTHHLKIHI